MNNLTRTQNRINKALLLGLILVLLSACGAKKTVRFDQQVGTGFGGFGSQSSLAYCSNFSNGNLAGDVKVYTNEYGMMVDQSLEILFSTDAANHLNGSTKAIKFYKWYARPDGSTYLNPTPIQITVKSLQSNSLVTGLWNELSVTRIQEFITYNALGNMTVADFLNNFAIVITQVELEYDVIRAVVTDSANIVTQVDFLAPAFASDPNTYMASHPAVLHPIHPNYGIRQLGFNVEQYFQRLAGFCF
ncbi:MAG: hypothetical protein SGJ18_12845 [Pseudomonadota bacterium]|nr:hypothetical protein [Pseudomonadota bacterium]